MPTPSIPARKWGPLLGGCTLLVVAGLTWQPGAPVSAEPLALAERPDGRSEAYYTAGDDFLAAGMELLEDYWGDLEARDGALLRGHVDNYLPLTLKAWEYRPAHRRMAHFADLFFAARHPQTGLIPYAYDTELPGNPQNPKETNLTTANKQPVSLIRRGIEFCRWFPDDAARLEQCLELAASTVQYFDVEGAAPSGLWGWVDVAADSPRSSLTLTQDYGQVAQGMAYLSQATGNPEWLAWADEKLQFVWQHPLTSDFPLLQEQFILTRALTRPEEPSSDTDTLYYVRQLFELYAATGNPQYRDWALAVTDMWVEQAWVPEWGHFIRKLNPDGTPAVDSLYGDGKYNTLYILVDAYRVTAEEAYLERLRLAWDRLQQLGQGLAPEAVRRGQMVTDQGLDPQQTFFLDILVEAFNASGDEAFLQAAEQLGTRILAAGAQLMRLESGQAGEALLKLAQARQPIGRLEIDLETAGHLEIRQGETVVLSATVPTPVAVIYLPEGTYSISGDVPEPGLVEVRAGASSQAARPEGSRFHGVAAREGRTAAASRSL